MTKVLELPSFRRPREKLVEQGTDSLKDYELLAILLRTGYQGQSAIDIAKRILQQHGLEGLREMELKKLARLKGIGISRASTVVAALELARRAFADEQTRAVITPADVANVTHYLVKKKQEYLVALYLNARNELIDSETISIGTLTSSLVHPREVFAPALEKRAGSVIVVHNHPSGDSAPSADDLTVTERLVRAGALLGISLIDHVIVSHSGFVSLREADVVDFESEVLAD